MLTEMYDVEFDVMKIHCENCKEVFYTCEGVNICPHCDHACSEESLNTKVHITDYVLIELNRKTMEFEAYNS